MFESKAGAYPKEHLSGVWVGSGLRLQTFDQVGNACQGQTHELIWSTCKLQIEKSFVNVVLVLYYVIISYLVL
jgi:hypothetical protein